MVDTAQQVADVVVVGSVNVDLVYTLDRRPDPGETVLGHALAHHPGGKGANQAAAAARAGAHVLMVGAVADDQYGPTYLRGLREQGVDTSGIDVLAGSESTGVAIISVTPDGENSIVVIPGANAHLSPASLPPSSRVRPGGVVLCQLEVPVETVAAAAKLASDAGARFALNPSPIRPLAGDLLRLCDPLIVNRHEAGQLLGESSRALAPHATAAALATALLELGPRSVAVTLGGKGAVWAARGDASDGGPVHVDAPNVEVLDTTGAGDAFAGALVAALAATDDGPTALAAAVTAGSTACGWRGAQPWRLDRT